MSRALYDSEYGYYARGPAQVGRAGDFFTSVSVGPLFGHLLARRFLRWRRESGCVGAWRLLELGAHDGKLARDILETVLRLDPDAYGHLEYVIAEPLDNLHASQQATLAEHAPRVCRVREPGESAVEALPGIAFGNELLDALPFHVVTWKGGCWHETGVAPDPRMGGRLGWCDLGPVSGDLASAMSRIDAGMLPDGYRTEVRTGYGRLHAALAAAISSGMVLWIDYGFARPEYYDPARVSGTLRTFSGHRAGEEPLANPGSCDITAHVDFTAVAEDAAAAGFALAAFQSQGTWLIREARDWMAEMEGSPDAAAIRQFQTLTHPAHLGSRFHAIELVVPGPPTATAADFHRCGLA